VSRGFGFVTFKNRKVAETVMAQAHRINNKSVEAKLAVQKGEQIVETFEEKMAKQIFIGGLPPNTTSDELKEWAQSLFGHDKVTNAIAVLDLETKTTRGFGFVNFASPAMVDFAVQPGMVYELNSKRVDVKRAQAQQHHHHVVGAPRTGRGGRGRRPDAAIATRGQRRAFNKAGKGGGKTRAGFAPPRGERHHWGHKKTPQGGSAGPVLLAPGPVGPGAFALGMMGQMPQQVAVLGSPHDAQAQFYPAHGYYH